MLIRNAAAFLEGRFCEGTDLRLRDGRILEIGQGLSAAPGEETVDLAGDFLLPGFVDVHIHAFCGQDTMAGEGAVRAMSRDLYREGVAAFCPTTMSASPAETAAAVAGVRQVMLHPEMLGARVLGAHMEAPFLSANRCGAQVSRHFADPDWETFLNFCGGHAEAVRLITLAPERPGSEAFIRRAAPQMTVSIGHSDATADQVHRAADWGATHVTHTFNAQTPLHHREPGVPGAAMTDDRLYAEAICDGIHLHPDVVRLLLRAKGPRRVLAVTDAMEAAGMPEGRYALGGQAVDVKDGAARLADGTLAGSVLTMRQAFHNLIHRFGIAPEDAALMCTATPAASIGELLAGRLAVGASAPVTRWSRDWQWRGILG